MRYIIINIKIIYLLFFLISKTLANEVVPVDIVADDIKILCETWPMRIEIIHTFQMNL